MSKKIVLDLDKIKIESSKLLNSLNAEASINAYYLLKNIVSIGRDVAISREIENIKDSTALNHKDISRSYREALEASGNAKSTVDGYSNEVKRFFNYVKENKVQLNLLSQNNINTYLANSKSGRNLSPNSYSKLVVVVRSFVAYLYKNGYISVDIASDLKVPRRVDREREYLTDTDIKKITGYLDNREERYKGENLRDKLIFQLGINCGLRKAEIMKLNWENINFEECKIKIIQSKGNKDRKVFFNGELMELLTKYRKTIDSYKGAVVRGTFGKKITSCPFQRAIRRIYEESGVYRNGLTVHSLRHTFAENLREKGIDIKVIKTLLGHSSLATTDRYLHISSSDLKKAAL